MLYSLKRSVKFFTGAVLAGMLFPAQADVLVLIHGYMGSPDSWENSRVNDLLELDGWQRGGIIIPDSRRHIPDRRQRANNTQARDIFYMVDMPWMSPLLEQTDHLDVAMQRVLEMRPGEDITLVGHSAGALVARLWLVQHYDPAVKRLISIAAPNLGTERAIDALDLTDPVFAPLDAVRNIFGGKLYNTVRRSRPLVYDFTPPSRRNPNVLYWLNQQAHPDIEYISVVREDRRGKDRDWLITAESQDLNNVPVLRGKSASYVTPQKHPLNREDGHLLTTILAESKRQGPSTGRTNPMNRAD